MDMPGGASLRAPNTVISTKKAPTSFFDLPAELRILIYTLSGCLDVHQCRTCNRITYGDDESLRYQRLEKTPVGVYRNEYRFTPFPYVAHACCLKTQSDRCHANYEPYVKPPQYADNACGFAHSDALLWINRDSRVPTHHKVRYTATQKSASKFPVITQTCTALRADILSILVATHRIYATVFDSYVDGPAILRVLAIIGRGNAANIKRLDIVYSKKQDLRYINGVLKPAMKEAGVRIEDNVVVVERSDAIKKILVGHTKRAKALRNGGNRIRDPEEVNKVDSYLKLPMCKCEYCVVRSLRKRAFGAMHLTAEEREKMSAQAIRLGKLHRKAEAAAKRREEAEKEKQEYDDLMEDIREYKLMHSENGPYFPEWETPGYGYEY